MVESGRGMSLETARGLAAQAWCDPRTERIIMDPVLAEVIAEKLLYAYAAGLWDAVQTVTEPPA